jgi:hypothetical protein
MLKSVWNLLFFIPIILGKSCYWDSDCDLSQCCIDDRCRSSSSCKSIRGKYPRDDFQLCQSNEDCLSGCCHGHYCILEDACTEMISFSNPIFIILIVIVCILLILIIWYIIENQVYKEK